MALKLHHSSENSQLELLRVLHMVKHEMFVFYNMSQPIEARRNKPKEMVRTFTTQCRMGPSSIGL